MKTIGEVLRYLFDAYPYFPGQARRKYPAPILPFDVFAATGILLELSGAYHHISSIKRSKRSSRWIDVGLEDLDSIRVVAVAWRNFADTLIKEENKSELRRYWKSQEGQRLQNILRWWQELISYEKAPVYEINPSVDAPAPKWWRPAYLLFATADESCSGVGFRWHDENKLPWFEEWWHEAFAAQDGSRTLSSANVDVLCVLPKARTSPVGCTIRSLSHNLALLPPAGIASADWTPYLWPSPEPDEQHMNFLLVPFPYNVSANSFSGRLTEAASGRSSGVFEIKQDWLKDVTGENLLAFLQDLNEYAKREVDEIHAVIFPELALNEALFLSLAGELPSVVPSIELLVSGVSQHEGRAGNFVGMVAYQKSPEQLDEPFAAYSVREKHHRWCLNKGQVEAYGLQGVMSPAVAWWEDIDLTRRKLDFMAIRAGTVVSAMICEDLARVDPCQEIIRALGPNIVFALLMDAPQRRERWPGRHATTLAEDPGCAVLTLTSKALMNRQNGIGIYASKGSEDRIVALWRDDSDAKPRHICCPDEAHAVVVSLSGTRIAEKTLDGRSDGTAVSWQYGRDFHVQLASALSPFSPESEHEPKLA